MFDIARITLREITLALREPFRISSGVTYQRRVLLLQLTDGDGLSGWSECVAPETPNYSPETMETCRLAVRSWLAPLLLGQSFERAADVIAVLDPPVRGHRMAKATLEMASWALEAERRGISLATLLGGTRSAIEVGISLGMQPSPEALAEKVIAAKREGYRRIKLKIAPGADLAYVRAAREALGPDTQLSVDANAAYQLSDADHLRALDKFDLLMIEQPLEGEDLRQHAALQQELRTPLCLDESITSPARAADMIALGSGKIVNIKSGRVGGLRPAQEIHDLCAQHDIPVWCGGMLETGIGRAHNVALASLPNFRLPGDVSPSARYWERDIVTPEWTMTPDGTMLVPHDRPGLGVAVDVDRIDDLTQRSDELTA
jgi:O-succinylbenzoate synthase